MSTESTDKQMSQLNKYAREYINNYDHKASYQLITEQMREFSGADYAMFNIFDTNEKDFTLVGFEGNKKNIDKAMDIIGYNIIGKKFKCEEVRNEQFEKAIVTKVLNSRAKVTQWSENGRAALISGILTDISERKNIEEKLKENQVRLELAMDAGENGFWDWNLTEDSTYFSPTFYTMLGYEDKEIPMNFDIFKNLIHPDDAKKVISKTEKTIEDGTPYEVEFRLKCKDGSYKWILDKAKAYFNDESEKPYRAVGVHVDINERKIAETKSRESEIRFNIAVEGTEAGVWDWDMVNHKVTFSSQWKNMLGYSDDEIGNSFEDWIK